jgi:hypothetical protein
VFVHPDIHLEIARQRHQDVLADADRCRRAKRLRRHGRRLPRAAPQIEHVATQQETETALHTVMKRGWKGEQVLAATTHFGHRETDGITVDLFWTRGNHESEFRVEVEDRREGASFVLYPTTGREAIKAFYHPFAAARAALNGKAWA